MRLWIGSLLALVLVALPLLGQGKSGDEKGNDRAAQAKAIQSDYKKAGSEVRSALQTAKTPQEQKEIIAEFTKRFTPRILKFVEADPKDKLSLRMLIFALQALPIVDGKIYDQLVQNWTKEEGAENQILCQFLIFRTHSGATKYLQKVLDENKNKAIQGFACFALAKMATEKKNEGDKKAGEEAEKYYERVVKEFANLRVQFAPQTTLGEQSKGALFEIRHLSVGKTPPNVESRNLDGKKVALKDYQGKVVVLDIWATWCGPCKSMIPHERELVKKHKDKPFALISISGDEEKATLKKFLETNDMPWVHWWDGPEGNITKGWNVQGFPTIYVLDPKGVIRYKFDHAVTKELDEAVEKLLAESKGAK